MDVYIWGNIILILCFALLSIFFSDYGTRFATFVFTLWFGFCASILGWIIYVAAHFISKYW